MITAKATRQESAPNQTYVLFWLSGTWGASGLGGLTRSIESQPELILAVALLAVPHPHQLGRPSFRGIRLPCATLSCGQHGPKCGTISS